MADDTTEDDDITLAESFEQASELAGEEVESFDGEVPKHAAGLLAARATDLVETLINIDMAEASEKSEDPTEDQINAVVEEDAVDIFMALGTLVYEYDIDIAGKFEERLELIEDYKTFRDAVEDAETQEEAIEAVDEHMTEELSKVTGGDMGALDGATPLEPGDNVDAEDYEHEDTDKSFA